jgi:hypothetical protein
VACREAQVIVQVGYEEKPAGRKAVTGRENAGDGPHDSRSSATGSDGTDNARNGAPTTSRDAGQRRAASSESGPRDWLSSRRTAIHCSTGTATASREIVRAHGGE